MLPCPLPVIFAVDITKTKNQKLTESSHHRPVSRMGSRAQGIMGQVLLPGVFGVFVPLIGPYHVLYRNKLEK